MATKYRIYSSSPSTSYLAIKLAERGEEVEIVFLPEVLRFRPLRLPGLLAEEIRESLISFHQSPQVIEASLEVGLSDRWVDPVVLSKSLRKAAETAVQHVRNPEFLTGPTEYSEDTWLLADSPLEKSPYGWSWPAVSRSYESESYVLEVSELYLPEGRAQEVEKGEMLYWEGCFCFLEPHPTSGYVLSFYSPSRYALERAIQMLQDPKGKGPTHWRALIVLNAGMRCLQYTQKVGLLGLQSPASMQLSSLIGTYSPLGNIHEVEAFYQAQRLLKYLNPKGSYSEAERASQQSQWYKKERKLFKRFHKRLRMWERLLFEPRQSPWMHSLNRALPSRIQRIIKSPLSLT